MMVSTYSPSNPGAVHVDTDRELDDPPFWGFPPDNRSVKLTSLGRPCSVLVPPTRTNTGATGRNYPLIPYLMAAGFSPFHGIAKGAYELFLDRLPGRGIGGRHPAGDDLQPAITRQVGAAEETT